MKRLMIVVLGLTLSGYAVSGSGWTGSRTILELETTQTGTEIRLAGFGGACTQLTEAGIQKTWAKIAMGQANEKQLISAALMAFAAGKQVDVYCADGAEWANLTHIRIRSE